MIIGLRQLARLPVLVGHYPVDARLIGKGVLFVVLVIQHVGFLGIEAGLCTFGRIGASDSVNIAVELNPAN